MLIACPDCDLLQHVPMLTPGDRACCARCGHILAAGVADPLDRPLALTVAALIVLVIANATPMMGLSVVGRHASTTILGGSIAMWQTGQPVTAVAVAFCAFLAPAVMLVSLLTVLLAVRRPPAPAWVGELLRWSGAMKPWAMVEVMMLGVLVALVKIAELATVQAGIGMFAIFALMLIFPAIVGSLDEEQLWLRIGWADGELPHVPTVTPGALP